MARTRTTSAKCLWTRVTSAATPSCRTARSLRDTVIARTHTAPSEPSVAVMAREGDGAPQFWISPADVVVRWPPPGHERAALAALP